MDGDGEAGSRIGHVFVGLGGAFLVLGLVSVVVALGGTGGSTQLFLLAIAVPLLVSGLRLVKLGLIGLRGQVRG
jgi:hypothetical protein